MFDYDIVTLHGALYVEVFNCETGARVDLTRIGRVESPWYAGQCAVERAEASARVPS